MQALTNTRTTIIARLSREIESLSTRRKTPQNRENLRRLRGERTAYERGNRMPPVMGTDRNYSAPYAYLVTLRVRTYDEDAGIFTLDITILSERRLTLKGVKSRAYDYAAEHIPSVHVVEILIEAALHHA